MNYYPEYSNFVKGVDTAFLFILGVSFFFLIGLTITVIVFIIKYNRKKHPVAIQMKDNMLLETIWTVIPLILVLMMFYYGYIGYMPMRNAPEDAYIIKTEGRMWAWEFTYPNGKTSKDLYVPINKPVKLLMTSPDVIHSLYIPAFRVKEDLVPGQETQLWFIANQIGSFEVLCAEYCGVRHSYMEAKAIVMKDADFNNWVADYSKPKDENAEGLAILKKNSCLGCHSINGDKLVGPSFKAIFEAERNVDVNGSRQKVEANAKYIKESIFEPNAKIVEGFSPNMMQTYKGIISEKEADQIIDYLKELK